MTRQRPTILQIIPRMETGGAELSTIEVTAAIVKAGGRAIVLTEGGRLAPHITDAGGELILFPAAAKNPLRLVWNSRAIDRIAAAEGVDIIHARSRAPAWSALLSCRRMGIPFVTTYHGAYSEKGRLKKLYNSVMVRSDAVIANSVFTSELIQSRYGTARDKITVIHRGVDILRYAPEAVSVDRVKAIRAAWNVSEADEIILHPARLSSWKGQADVIVAAKGVIAKHPNAVVVFAGDAQGRVAYLDGLKDQIARAGLDKRVRFAGHVSDMPAAFAAAKVAVLASREPEAFGRTAIEAQAMGCPVISTNIGAPPETIRAVPHVSPASITGWLVPVGDAASLECALVEALKLPDAERSQMGKRARANVEAHFTIAAMQAATLSVYERVLASR